MAAIMAIAAGCSSDAPDAAPVAPADPNVMTFDVEHPTGTVSRATDTAFELGDKVGLYIAEAGKQLQPGGNYITNRYLTCTDGGNWTPSTPIYWNDGNYDIYAYYPYRQGLEVVDDIPFEVALDQTQPDSYEASDFLWAVAKQQAGGNGAVRLQFGHKLSRMYIRLVKGEDYEGELPDDAEVYIHNTVPAATIDLAVGVVTKDAHATAKTLRARSLGRNIYTAIIVPQRIDNRVPLVEVIAKGVSYLYEAKFQFKPGVQHNMQIAISKNPDQVKIDIGGEIENWN